MMMTKKIEVIEIENEGLPSLLGQRVLLMCANFYYEGILEGVNDICCLLSDAGMVYSTGDWAEKEWSVREQLPGNHYVMIHAIESFCKSTSGDLS